VTSSDTGFGSQISKGILWKALTISVAFVASIYFARTLGPTDYGIFTLIVMLTNLLSNPLSGWATACKKRLSEVTFPTDQAVGIGVFAVIIVSPLLAVAFGLFEIGFDVFGLTDYLLMFAVLFFVSSLFEVLIVLLTGLPNFSSAMRIDTIRSIVKTIFQFVFVSIGFGVAGMVGGMVFATFAVVPVMMNHFGTLPAVPSRDALRSIAGYARYSTPKYLLSGLYSRLDILLIGALLTSAAVAQYQVVFKLTMPAGIMATVAGGGLMSRVSRQRSKQTGFSTDVNRSLWMSSILAVPIVFGVAAMPDVLIKTTYGPDFVSSPLVLVGIAGFKLIDTQTKQLRSVIDGIDRPDVNLKLLVLTLPVSAICGYVLVQSYGIPGVVAGFLVAESMRYAVMGYFVKRHFGRVRLVSDPLKHQIVAAVIMFLVVKGVMWAFVVESLTPTVVTVALGAVSYGAVLFIISAPHREFGRSLFGPLAFGIQTRL